MLSVKDRTCKKKERRGQKERKEEVEEKGNDATKKKVHIWWSEG
jgi:hypothetical protein